MGHSDGSVSAPGGAPVRSYSIDFTLSSFKVSHLVGGLCGGVTSTLITHPFDLIKLRLAGKCSLI